MVSGHTEEGWLSGEYENRAAACLTLMQCFFHILYSHRNPCWQSGGENRIELVLYCVAGFSLPSMQTAWQQWSARYYMYVLRYVL